MSSVPAPLDFSAAFFEAMQDPAARAAAEQTERERVAAAYGQWLRDTYRPDDGVRGSAFEGGWKARDGEGPDQEVVNGILQLLSVLLAQTGPFVQTADDSYADPAITSWADEARDVLHYALEGGLDDDYTVGRLKELGGYVSPRELCSECGGRLTAEELVASDEDGYDGQLCDACCNPGDPVPGEDTVGVEEVEKTIAIIFIVNGVDVPVKANPGELLSAARDAALQQSGNTGRKVDGWQVRDEKGVTFPPDQKVERFSLVDGARLFLMPCVGAGGCGIEGGAS